MAGRICFAGICMTKGVPNLERGFVRPKLGTPFSFLRCFLFCGRVLRTAPLDSIRLNQKGRIFLCQGFLDYKSGKGVDQYEKADLVERRPRFVGPARRAHREPCDAPSWGVHLRLSAKPRGIAHSGRGFRCVLVRRAPRKTKGPAWLCRHARMPGRARLHLSGFR